MCGPPTPSGAGVQVKWAAAAYSRMGSTDVLQIKPVDDNAASLFKSSDHAGTPENFSRTRSAGRGGAGGSNSTGSYSGTARGASQ